MTLLVAKDMSGGTHIFLFYWQYLGGIWEQGVCAGKGDLCKLCSEEGFGVFMLRGGIWGGLCLEGGFLLGGGLLGGE